MQKWIQHPSDSLLMLGDFNANYYVFPYEVNPDIVIVIKGKFPYSRYMSFTLAGQLDNVITTASDKMLIPDSGSTNPFLPCADWNADNRNYTIKLLSPLVSVDMHLRLERMD
ncbi:hypothetical protein A500_10275 [Clostridium sartagoforme AAU1]|uniref:Endonuclease/exonuclease/phosphatase domain-containing protein n=1 Tax=Clostridium sartagoforme AAU1 TaxID=1202534 RepID=R9C8D7_9CLOT|nr:hypothetical protein [Clostridium sartagoforme]EOR25255.1 hypothetical protein A500_10275 [Clostridium sartagoforme AAU1]